MLNAGLILLFLKIKPLSDWDRKRNRLHELESTAITIRDSMMLCSSVTGDMLERYCKALGISLFDETFYGMKAAVINTVQKLPVGAPFMSLADARAHIIAGG